MERLASLRLNEDPRVHTKTSKESRNRQTGDFLVEFEDGLISRHGTNTIRHNENGGLIPFEFKLQLSKPLDKCIYQVIQ